jgi:hypothetical protein
LNIDIGIKNESQDCKIGTMGRALVRRENKWRR